MPKFKLRVFILVNKANFHIWDCKSKNKKLEIKKNQRNFSDCQKKINKCLK